MIGIEGSAYLRPDPKMDLSIHPYQMTTRKFLASLFVRLVFAYNCCVAQAKLAEEADDAFKKGFYFNAIELYKKAYTVEKKASTKAESDLQGAVKPTARSVIRSKRPSGTKRPTRPSTPIPVTYLYIGDMLEAARQVCRGHRFIQSVQGEEAE